MTWSRPVSWLSQIAEQSDQLQPEPGDRVEDRIFFGEDHHIGLRAAAACVEPRLFTVVWQQDDAHREQLRLTQPSLVRLNGRHLAGGGFIALAGAPTDALDPPTEKLSRLDIQRDQNLLPGLDVAELVLPHIGGNPAWSAFEETEQRLSGTDELAGRQAKVGDHAVGRRHHRRVA